MELGICIPIALAIFGSLIKLFVNQAKIDSKLSILWEAYREEAKQSTRRRGVMEAQSEYRLTKQGFDLISPELKDEIKNLISLKRKGIKWPFNRNQNPDSLKPWDIITKLGGVQRLSKEADKADITLGEMIVMVETLIKRHFNEI